MSATNNTQQLSKYTHKKHVFFIIYTRTEEHISGDTGKSSLLLDT